MPQSMDKTITKKVLSDSTIYRETTMAAFTKTCEGVIQAITTVVRPRLVSLSQCKIPSTASYAGLDVTSLYTNVNNNNAVDAVISLYQQHQSQIPSMGFNANEIKIMLDAVLACNIFCFNDKIFEQRQGLAMGNAVTGYHFLGSRRTHIVNI
ncbi:hypothetical protein Y032_0846g2659 [Ancylostoma ceylanicum]|nr:hypothetical protein Y032_0846g2659 [Ancylostoma ceylanicum]